MPSNVSFVNLALVNSCVVRTSLHQGLSLRSRRVVIALSLPVVFEDHAWSKHFDDALSAEAFARQISGCVLKVVPACEAIASVLPSHASHSGCIVHHVRPVESMITLSTVYRALSKSPSGDGPLCAQPAKHARALTWSRSIERRTWASSVVLTCLPRSAGVRQSLRCSERRTGRSPHAHLSRSR